MVTLNIKILYWIICLIIYIGYLAWPREREYGYLSGIGPAFRFIISTLLYSISWIIWFIIFK